MTLVYIGSNNLPTYIAVNADIEDNATIVGAYRIGKLIYLSDTQTYKLILPNLKLIPFAFANGTAGTEPTYVSSEVGIVSSTIVVVTFSENISAVDYLLGVKIKVSGTSVTISSGVRQANHAVVRYTITPAVVNGNIVTWEYNSVLGGIVSETGTVYLENVTPQIVTNNVV